jgi:hypothetical protein
VGGGWQRFRSWTFAIPGYYSCSAQTNVYIYTVGGDSGQRTPARVRVADRGGGVGLLGELAEGCFKPGAELVEQGLRPGLPGGLPDLRRASAYLALDGVQSGDALDRLRCCR